MNQKRYAYLIGANGPDMIRLKHAEKDIKLLAKALQEPYCHFTSTEVVIAHSRQDGLKSLKQFSEQCKPSDLLLVHFSGHAWLDEQLYLLCNDTDINDPWSTALEMSVIKRYLRNSKAQHKLLILDCCHAAGAQRDLLKGGQSISNIIDETMKGSAAAILAACAQNERTREIDELDGGSGFLSWAIRAACTTHFDEVSSFPNDRTLSLDDIRRWLPRALKYVNTTFTFNQPLPSPIISSEQEIIAGDIWLTDPPREISTKVDEKQKRYLQNIYKRYSSVTLPIGPTEGFSLQAIFQPLALRRDPFAAEHSEHKKGQVLLSKQKKGEKEDSSDSEERKTNNLSHETKDPLQPVIAENAEEALKKSTQGRIVILGGPGTGKTTTLKHLVGCRAKEALSHPSAPIPIFLSLTDLARSGKTFQSYLINVVNDMGVDESYAQTLWRVVEHGQAFIVLDSLDEVDPMQRVRMIDFINSRASEQGNTWLIGSRYSEYKGGQFKYGQFTEWELLPINAQLRRDLTAKLFPELQRLLTTTVINLSSPSTFVTQLENHRQAAAWGENPLLLSLAAVVFAQTGGLPPSRASLYRSVVEGVIAMREPDLVARNNLLRPLTGLALWLHQKKMIVFTSDDLLTFLEDIQHRSWEEAEAITKRIISSGLLDVIALSTYKFRHQTFQEYLAATELAKLLTSHNSTTREEAWKLIYSKRTYSRWTEVLSLMVGLLMQTMRRDSIVQAEKWLTTLTKQRISREGDPGDLGLSLAIKSCVEVIETESNNLRRIERDIINTWIEGILTEKKMDVKNPVQMNRFVDLASEIGQLDSHEVEKGINLLKKAFFERNAKVRKTIIKVFGRLNQYAPIELLINALNDGNGSVRYAAVEALGHLGERVPSRRLVSMLNNGLTEERLLAVSTLGSLGEHIPIEPLIAALNDVNEQVRIAAVEALGNQLARAPIEPLVAALKDKKLHVRARAARVLGQLGDSAPLEPLVEALNDEDGLVQTEVLYALAKLGARAPVGYITSQLDDIDYRGREVAVNALGLLKSQIAVDPLVNALNDEEAQVRAAAASALGELGEYAPTEPLIDALNDEDVQVRVAAAKSLGLLKRHIPIEPLLIVLDDEEKNVRNAAAYSLGRSQEILSNEDLLVVLETKLEWMRIIAIQMLEQIGISEHKELIMSTLEEQRDDIRIAAIQALSQLESHVPVESLLVALKDKNGRVRASAIQVLGKLGEKAPVNILIEMLSDGDKEVHLLAIQSLSDLKERAPVDVLISLLDTEKRFDVLVDVVQALSNLERETPIERLVKALEEDVRWFALEALKKNKKYLTIKHFSGIINENKSMNATEIEALGLLGKQAPMAMVLSFIDNPGVDIRAGAIRALGHIGEFAHARPLLNALADSEWQVRQAAIWALGQLSENTFLDKMVVALEDDDWRVRWEAVKALGLLGKQAPIEKLLITLDDPNPLVRQAAGKVLSRLSEYIPMETWMTVLDSQDVEIRVAAIQALGQLKEHAPTEILVENIYDERVEIRVAAIQALGQLKEHAPVEPIVLALGDSEPQVRLAAIQTLKRIHPDSLSIVVPELIAVIQRKNPGHLLGSIIQASIADIIGNLGTASPVLLEKLTSLLDWPYWQVRTKAIHALEKLHRNIPDAAIRQLLKFRCDPDPKMRAVRNAAESALFHILSLETGIEDD